jgi:2-polyprenyl-6-hydroxyphenyl methylase/3-demethylubiquinone-9 3-methyltransferase
MPDIDPLNVPENYAYWQKNGEFWVNEYKIRRTTTARYGLQEILLSCIIEANSPARVLEFGCGVGRHLSYLSRIPGVQIEGVDQSPTMLSGVPNFVGDSHVQAHLIEPLGRLPFSDREFDIVYSAEVLIHVRPEDLDGRLAEMVRVCRGSLVHLEPPIDYVVFEDAHNGCWAHDLIAAYARLGLTARRIGRPIEAQELVVVGLDSSHPLRTPGEAALRHIYEVESFLQPTLDHAAQAPSSKPDTASPTNAPRPSAVDVLADRLAALGPAISGEVAAAFSELPTDYRAKVEIRRLELGMFRDRGTLPAELVRSEWVLDWECGDCAFAIAMLLEGARHVIAADSWLNESALPQQLLTFPGLVTAKLDVAGIVAALAKVNIQLDMVFANTVSEHIPDLPAALSNIRRALRPGGHFFNNHDNYYQPCGSHDHGFLFYGPNSEIVFQGVRCWEMDEKCEASATHRESIQRNFHWTLSPEQELTRKPEACDRCFYFRRAQPWAHLLNQTEFQIYFGNETFFTGRPRSVLNKVTLFQLRQYIVEAGMKIMAFDRSHVVNDPPAALLNAPYFFSKEDLVTCTATMLAKPS